ncbi:MAG: hypothetical protein A3K03_10150 [Bdellovibrionales bacterium RIFOXYD1_FULL_44_7]|nr:MAG: hypothetical protein A3K03_10150 [Bdellovibrionales bacterium RIFOXYD1_FULL_44_7]
MRLEKAIQFERLQLLRLKKPNPLWFAKVNMLIRTGSTRDQYFLATRIFTKPYSALLINELELLIEKSDPQLLNVIKQRVLTQPWTNTAEYERLKNAVLMDNKWARIKFLRKTKSGTTLSGCIRSFVKQTIFGI